MNKVKVFNDVDLKDRLVAINRVTKVTKGGRTFTFAAIVVVGDGKGVIGYGLGKAGEVTAAIAKGVEAAKKNLVKVPVLEGHYPSRGRGSLRRCSGVHASGCCRYWSRCRWCYACRTRQRRRKGHPCKVKGLF